MLVRLTQCNTCHDVYTACDQFSILWNCYFLDSCSCVPYITAFNVIQIHAHDNLFDTSRDSLQVDGVHDRPVTPARAKAAFLLASLQSRA